MTLGNAHGDRPIGHGCIGVPSVIYFAIQLREQNRERRQSAVNALTVQWGELTKALHETRNLPCFICAVFSRSMISMSCRKLRFSAFQNRFFKNFEGMYYSRQEGILTADLWSEIERTMSDFLAYDGVRQWWETRKHWHTEAFVGVRRCAHSQEWEADGLFDL